MKMETIKYEGNGAWTAGWWILPVMSFLVSGAGACRTESRGAVGRMGNEEADKKKQAGHSGGPTSNHSAGGKTRARHRQPGERMRAAVLNGPGGPRSVLIDHPSLPQVETVLEEMRKARALKSAGSTDALVKAALPKLRRWSDLLVSYSEKGKRRQADLVAAAMVDLKAHWGDDLFPPAKFDAFVRDRFEVRKRVVFAAQFFQPMMYHRDKRGSFFKHYRFSVYVKGRILWRYYLESLKPTKGSERFILAKQAGGRHVEVADMGTKRPSYWEVRRLVRKDLTQAVAAGLLPLQ